MSRVKKVKPKPPAKTRKPKARPFQHDAGAVDLFGRVLVVQPFLFAPPPLPPAVFQEPQALPAIPPPAPKPKPLPWGRKPWQNPTPRERAQDATIAKRFADVSNVGSLL